MKREASTISSLITRYSTKYTNSSELRCLVENAKLKALEIAELQA